MPKPATRNTPLRTLMRTDLAQKSDYFVDENCSNERDYLTRLRGQTDAMHTQTSEMHVWEGMTIARGTLRSKMHKRAALNEQRS